MKREGRSQVLIFKQLCALMSYILKWHVPWRKRMNKCEFLVGVKVTYFNKYLNVSIQHTRQHVTQFRKDKKALLAPMVCCRGKIIINLCRGDIFSRAASFLKSFLNFHSCSASFFTLTYIIASNGFSAQRASIHKLRAGESLCAIFSSSVIITHVYSRSPRGKTFFFYPQSVNIDLH